MEISKICHAVCIFITLILHEITRTMTTTYLAERSPVIVITLILHEITRTMTTKYLAERSPIIFEYEVNIRVSRRHSDSIK